MVRYVPHRVALVALAGALGACGSPAPPTAPRAETTAADARPAPAVASGAPAADGGAVSCRMTVTEASGCTTSDIEAMIAPARARIEGCRNASGGKIRIRMRNVGGKLVFDVEPSASLDPTERRCVLEALSTLHDDGSNLSTGATIPPSGFTSIILFEW
jgi:hypothetical protein